MINIPINIVNKILYYIGELNNNIIIVQYNNLTHTEYYKINLHSDLLWNLKSTIAMKKLYSLYNPTFSSIDERKLYKYGKAHYEILLRKKIQNINKTNQ